MENHGESWRIMENHGESWESLFMSCENLWTSSCHHFFRTFIAASCRTGTCTSCSTCLLFVGLGCGIPKMKFWNSKYPATSTCQKNTGFFKRNSHPTSTLARTARHPWSPNFNVVWKQRLAEPSKKTAIVAPAIEKWWFATLIQGGPGASGACWNFLVDGCFFFLRTRYGSLISSSDNGNSCAANNSPLSQNTDIQSALLSADCSAKASCAAGKVRTMTAMATMSSSAVSNLLQLWLVVLCVLWRLFLTWPGKQQDSTKVTMHLLEFPWPSAHIS